MLTQIRDELERISARDVRLSWASDFDPSVGTLLKVEAGDAYWHLLPEPFLDVLQQLPPGTGSEGVKQAIEQHANFVWHGPSPEGSRESSP